MHRTVIWRVIAALALALVLILPAAAPVLAEEPATGSTHDRPVVLQANADLTVPADTNWDTVVLFAADATVLGTVDTVVVVDGTATLTGAHVATLVVVGGAVDIGTGSVVGDVRTIDSTYDAAPGASVGSQSALEPVAIAVSLAPLAIALWIGAALAYVLAGLVVAAIAGGQLRRAGATITREPGVVTLAALGVLVGMPLLIAILAVTVVGIPTALAVAIIALPLVWFVGSVSVAVRIGDWILLQARGRVEAAHPVVAAFLGTVVVGVLSIIPLVGFLIGLAGAGAVSVVAWRAAFGGPDRGPARTVQIGGAPA
jgi:hypothetical protein